MHSRCYGTGNARYASHGGRGIRVCDRWRLENGFENFLADMGERPSRSHSLDRINNDGDYEPGNCRWATPKEQSNNTRRNRRITCNGVTMTIGDWGKVTGINRQTIAARIDVRGWPEDKAVSTPKGCRPAG